MLLRDWERTIDEVDKGECIYALEEKRVKGNEKKIREGKKRKGRCVQEKGKKEWRCEQDAFKNTVRLLPTDNN